MTKPVGKLAARMTFASGTLVLERTVAVSENGAPETASPGASTETESGAEVTESGYVDFLTKVALLPEVSYESEMGSVSELPLVPNTTALIERRTVAPGGTVPRSSV